MSNDTISRIGYLSLGQYYGYITVGTLAVSTNCAVLLILSINKHLLVNSAFAIGLALGDILDGVALLGNGYSRLYRALNNIPNLNVHPFYCMRAFTGVLLMGSQIPGAMFALIGLERYLAVGHFNWYYAKWTPKKAWLCTFGAYGICAISLTLAFLITYFQPANVKVSTICSTPVVMGLKYMLYNYGVTVAGGVIAVATTLVATVIFTKRKNRLVYAGGNGGNMLSYIKKQWRLTKSMLYLAVLDFGLVVMPNLLLCLDSLVGLSIAADLGPASLMTISLRSCFNLAIYLICNIEFRKAAFRAIGLKKCTTVVKTKITIIRSKDSRIRQRSTRRAWLGGSEMEAEHKF